MPSKQGWSLTKTELAVLRSERPKAPEQSGVKPTYTREILEAAACLSVGLDQQELLATYGERTLNAADPIRHIGLRELVAECARLEGMEVPRVFGDGTATIRAGFSTMSLPGIMENVMNKTLLAGLSEHTDRRLRPVRRGNRHRLQGSLAVPAAWHRQFRAGRAGRRTETRHAVGAEVLEQGGYVRSDLDADAARHHQR